MDVGTILAKSSLSTYLENDTAILNHIILCFAVLYSAANFHIQVKIFGYPAYQVSEFGKHIRWVYRTQGCWYVVIIIIFVLAMLVAVVLL